MSAVEAQHCPICGEPFVGSSGRFQECAEHGLMIVSTTEMNEYELDGEVVGR